MSFPGYLKSLQLKNGRHTELENGLDGRSSNRPGIDGDIVAARQDRHDDRTTSPKAEQNLHVRGDIVDEKGNHPTKSLWVGNIPPRTSDVKLRALFCRYGSIISTKPAAKYAFVNFETVESAFDAFTECHDRDIFNTGNSTINIRFTTTQAEARQGKDDVRLRCNSMTKNTEVVRRQWFGPGENVGSEPLAGSSTMTEWPNGRPPSGPKSQRRDISPPPLRRGDSYRPLPPIRQDSQLSGTSRGRSREEAVGRGPDVYRPSEYQAVNAHSESWSRSSSFSRSESMSRNRTARQESSESPSRWPDSGSSLSPLPWERAKKHGDIDDHQWLGGHTALSEHASVSSVPLKDSAADSTVARSISNSTYMTTSPEDDEDNDDSYSPKLLLQTPDSIGQEQCDSRNDPQLFNHIPAGLPQARLLTLDSLESRQIPKSPLPRAMEKVFGASNGVRGGSVASEVATSSSKTSTKKKKCGDCKKTASDLSPLIRCSTCSRGYHSGCGDPKPSGCPDVSQFICGRCLRKANTSMMATAAVAAPPTTIKDHQNAKLDGKVHLISPPLTHNQDGNGSTQLSPCEDLPRAVSSQARIESLFDVQDSIGALGSTVEPDMQDHQQSTNTRRDFERVPKSPPKPPMRLNDQTTICSQVLTNPQQRALRYKVVMCKWWAAGICTQSEESCYYAHNYTNISFPNGKKANRSWTCYNWLYGACEKHEEACLYAHKDTGLHVGRDGLPSFKHVTCYWWIRSNCRFAEKLCKFAHEDTGLYGLDPSEKWHGGPKFSTVHPSLASDQRTRQFPCIAVPIGNLSLKGLGAAEDAAVKQMSWQSGNSSVRTSMVDPKATRNDSVNVSQQFPQHSDSSSSNNTTDVRCDGSALTNNDQSLNTPITSFSSDCEHRESFGTSDIKDQNCLSMSTHVNLKTFNTEPKFNSAFPVSAVLRDVYEAKTDQIVNRPPESDAQTERSVRDPRLIYREPAPTSKTTILQSEDSLPTNATDAMRKQNAPEPIIAKRNSDGAVVSRKILQRCKVCQKPVFGAQICRTCVSDGSGQKPPIPSDQSSSSSVLPSASIGIVTQEVDVADALVQDLGRDVRELSVKPASKNPLKRSANNSNMFLKNKRPKSSMLFSSGGKMQFNTLRRPVDSQAHQTNDILTVKTQQPRQSLNDLIREGKAKKEAKSDEHIRNATPESPFVNANRRENGIHDSADEMTLSRASSPLPTVEIVQDAAQIANNTEDGFIMDDLFDSSPQSISKPHQTFNEHDGRDREDSYSSKSDSQPLAARRRRYRHSKTDSGYSKPDDEIRDLTKRTSASDIRVVEDGSQDHLTRAKAGSRKAGQFDRQLGPQAHAKDIVWASSITCMACRKNHKKCLHATDGSLSAQKCHEYVLSRDGRRDTGRSNQEWQAVLDAAQLDIDINEHEAPLPDDRFDIVLQKPSTLWNGEDYSSDGSVCDSTDDYMSDGEPGSRIKHVFKRFQKLPTVIVNVPISRESSHKDVKARIKKSVHETTWTTEDEMQATMRLKSKGVMFESESEDDDYLSDDYPLPQLPRRAVDPLHVPPRQSRDLFEVAPELGPQRLEEERLARIQGMKPRPSRKEQWANLRSRQLQDRRERFGNPHYEVSRVHAETTVTALIERVVSPANSEQDRFAVGSVQTREEEITFASFLGIPKSPRACLMSDGKRLAFKDGRNEGERTYIRTSRGLSKRTTDDEKFPVRTKW